MLISSLLISLLSKLLILDYFQKFRTEIVKELFVVRVPRLAFCLLLRMHYNCVNIHLFFSRNFAILLSTVRLFFSCYLAQDATISDLRRKLKQMEDDKLTAYHREMQLFKQVAFLDVIVYSLIVRNHSQYVLCYL